MKKVLKFEIINQNLRITKLRVVEQSHIRIWFGDDEHSSFSRPNNYIVLLSNMYPAGYFSCDDPDDITIHVRGNSIGKDNLIIEIPTSIYYDFERIVTDYNNHEFKDIT